MSASYLSGRSLSLVSSTLILTQVALLPLPLVQPCPSLPSYMYVPTKTFITIFFYAHLSLGVDWGMKKKVRGEEGGS